MGVVAISAFKKIMTTKKFFLLLFCHFIRDSIKQFFLQRLITKALFSFAKVLARCQPAKSKLN